MHPRAAVPMLLASMCLISFQAFAQETEPGPPEAPDRVNSGFRLFGGLAMPLGDFSDSDKGAAKTGFGLGAEFTLSLGNAGPLLERSGLVLHGAYTNNSTDLGAISMVGLEVDGGSYSNIWALGGLKTTIPASEEFSVDLSALAGAVFSKSPSATISGMGTVATLSSASATVFAWAFAADAVIAKHYTFGARYYYAKPKYTITYTIEMPGFPPAKATTDADQPIGMLLINVGYLF
jgi:hypothetical protein